MRSMTEQMMKQAYSSAFGTAATSIDGSRVSLAETPALRTGLTVDDIAHPAYMVNYNFDLTWYNDAARTRILGFESLPSGTESRNVFVLMNSSDRNIAPASRRELIRLYSALAKPRVSRQGLVGIIARLYPEAAALAEASYDAAAVAGRKVVVDMPCTLEAADGVPDAWQVYGIYFREGILIIHVPADVIDPSVLEFISRRDIVVRNLMRKQLPMFTSLAVLAASLEDAAKLRAELPVERYFELIQDVWAAMEPVARKYRGTGGRHVGDGIQYSFLPQPDGNYVANAQACAQEMKERMRQISSRWQLEMPWLGELKLTFELNERQEWLGSQSPAPIAPAHRTLERSMCDRDAAAGQTLRDIKALGAKLMAQQRSRSCAAARRLAA